MLDDSQHDYGMDSDSIRKADRVMRRRSFWRGFFFQPHLHACDYIAEFWRLVGKYDAEAAAREPAKRDAA